MTVIYRADEADLTFRVSGFDGELRVTAVRGEEGLSRPFLFLLELACDDDGIDFESMIASPALLTLRGEQGERHVHGVVSVWEQAEPGEHYTTYHAELVPAVRLLEFRRNCRIFQNKTVQDIITQILDDAGFSGDQFRFDLQDPGAQREYCVQYRETDLRFISRLMEYEGIFYFFEHSSEGHVLVMSDHSGALNPPEERDTFLYRPPQGLVSSEEHVHHFLYGEEVRPGAVVLRDFHHENPALNLEVTAQGDRDTSLEVAHWPGIYQEASVGNTLAGIRLEEEQVPRGQGQGMTTCRHFLPGVLFTLDEHPRYDWNQEYRILSVEHQAAQRPSRGEEGGDPVETGEPGYSCSFLCMPSSVPFRPPRTTPVPILRGPQTARVVGPSGEEIYTDDQGRIKVQFHWDREGGLDEKSSCWIRVSQDWAGGSYGSLFLPRVGQEVVVDFLEGNPDRPLVTGKVYNGDHTVPYGLPDHKTRSLIKTKSYKGDGSNEIRFEDESGSEQFLIHAQKDLDVRVLNDMKETVDNERHLVVKGAVTMQLGSSDTTAGDTSVQVSGQRSVTVEQDVLEEVRENHRVAVTQEYDLKAQTIIVEADNEITLKGSGNFIKLDSSEVVVSGVMVKINSGGSPGIPSVSAGPEAPATPQEVAGTSYGQDTAYSPVAPIQAEDVVPPDLETAAQEPEEQTVETEQDWIEVVLVDEDGEPFSGERFKVVHADGTVVAEGNLDAHGKAKVTGIDPGKYKVIFPDFEKEGGGS